MKTFSGVLVRPDNDGAPSLNDIARGLAEEVRFARQTHRPWTVLQHSLAVEEYARLVGWPRIARLHCLLHDAHEAVTGDVPYPWKTDDLRELQEELDVRIWASLGVKPPGLLIRRMVNLADADVLLAEADRVGTEATRDDVGKWLGHGRPSDAAMAAVGAADADTTGKTFEELVATFEGRVRELLK